MKSINFPGAYMKIGEGQEQYHTIHAMPIDGPEGEVVAIYELSPEELKQVNETGRIIYSRLTFGNGFQPFRISTEPIPFKAKLTYSNGDKIEVDAFVHHDGVRIPGYSKTENGQYIKNDD